MKDTDDIAKDFLMALVGIDVTNFSKAVVTFEAGQPIVVTLEKYVFANASAPEPLPEHLVIKISDART
jgi:hypothetical protein